MTAALFAGWLVDTLVASTLLMAALLLGRGILRRAFGPGIAYALWALPVLRLVLPPLPDRWGAPSAVSGVGERMGVVVIDLPAAGATPAQGSHLGLVVGIVWAIGAAVLLIRHVAAYRRLRRELLDNCRVVTTVGAVTVIESGAAVGPLAFGVWRRFVAVPQDFRERYDPAEQELALAHELGHHHRGDLIANWIGLATLSLHWWSPVGWRAFRAFRADQERANDARVLAGRSPCERHVYARAIVKAAGLARPSGGGVIAATCHLHTLSDLKGRLSMLSTFRLSRARLAGGVACTLALTGVGLGLTASGSRAAGTVTERVGAAMGVAVPQPPAPPAPPVPPTGSRAPTPPVPPAPPAVPAVRSGDGSSSTSISVSDTGGRRMTRVVLVRDGRTQRFEGAQVSERDCAIGIDGAADQLVITRPDGSGGIVVCSNRLTQVQARDQARGEAAAADAVDASRQAIVVAGASLREARANIASNPGLTSGQRAQALKSIDDGLAELDSREGGGGQD